MLSLAHSPFHSTVEQNNAGVANVYSTMSQVPGKLLGMREVSYVLETFN